MRERIAIDTTPNEAPITELFAWLSTDETGDGIIASIIGGMAMPMVTSKRRVAEAMRPFVEEMGRQAKRKVTLVRFVRETNDDPSIDPD